MFGIGAACLAAATSSRDGRQHKPCFFFFLPFLVAVDGFRIGEKKIDGWIFLAMDPACSQTRTACLSRISSLFFF